MRDNFVFYRSFYEAIGELPREMQLEVLLDLINYALNAVEPQSSGMAKAVFILLIIGGPAALFSVLPAFFAVFILLVVSVNLGAHEDKDRLGHAAALGLHSV